MDPGWTATAVAALIVTAADLLALTTCVGILALRLWVVRFDARALSPPSSLAHDGLVPLWWTLGVCLAVLSLSSAGELVRRAMAMSGRPLAESITMLATVLSGTHFGRFWLVRPLALAVLWAGWYRRHGLVSPGFAWAMLVSACAIAASRSLTGHAADWGDITLAELMDWAHLLGVSLWAGSVVALTLTGFALFTRRADARRRAIAIMAARWSTLAAVALAVVIVTGIYNAGREVGSGAALLATAYGRVLLAKLALVSLAVALGAANRYLGLPALRDWAEDADRAADNSTRSVPAALLSLLTLRRYRRAPPQPLSRFVRRASLEGALLIATLLCVAVLLGQTPARHTHRMPAGHGTHAGGAAH